MSFFSVDKETKKICRWSCGQKVLVTEKTTQDTYLTTATNVVGEETVVWRKDRWCLPKSGSTRAVSYTCQVVKVQWQKQNILLHTLHWASHLVKRGNYWKATWSVRWWCSLLIISLHDRFGCDTSIFQDDMSGECMLIYEWMGVFWYNGVLNEHFFSNLIKRLKMEGELDWNSFKPFSLAVRLFLLPHLQEQKHNVWKLFFLLCLFALFSVCLFLYLTRLH